MAEDPEHKRLFQKARLTDAKDAAESDAKEQGDLLCQVRNLKVQNEQLGRLIRDLEISRDKFAGLYESAPLGFISLNAEGIIQRANAAARHLLTGDEHAMIGHPFSSFVVPEDLPQYFHNKPWRQQKNRPSVFELRLYGPKGGRLHAQFHAICHSGSEGGQSRFDLAFFDVTEQARLEEQLRTSREHLELATQAGGIGIWNYDLKQNKTYWNEQLYRLLGLEPRKGPEEGGVFFDFIHPEDRKGALQSLQALMESQDELELEFRVIREDGQIRWMAAKGRIDRDETGRPVRIQGANWDISGKKRSEMALQQSRERFQTVLEHSLDVAFRRNLQTQKYDYLSPVIEQLTNYSADQITKMDSEELLLLIHPEDRTRVTAGVETACRTGSGKLTFRFQKKNGGYLWMADHFTIQKDSDGRPLYRIGVMRDITEQRRAEKALEEKQEVLSGKVFKLEHSNRELADYAYAVSHDLKAPLRAVRNYADFLLEDLEGQLTGDQKSYLEGMKKAISQGDELIRDLLDFSRIGQVMDAPEQVDLAELVRETCDMLDLPEEAQVSVPENCPPLTAERAMLRQILTNLIGNAVKFNDAEVKKVDVWCRPALHRRMELLVRDNGIGIGERYREKIFRVFQRLHASSVYEGTGIGLAIVRKAAAHLGGTVSVESTPGEGSTFIVNLPEDPPEPGEDAKQQ
jgi:PAS domain S-box-containing protein